MKKTKFYMAAVILSLILAACSSANISSKPTDSMEADLEAKDMNAEEMDAAAPASVPEYPVYITEEFQDLLVNSLIAGTAKDILQDMIVDIKMTDEELETYAADEVVAAYKQRVDEYGGLFLKVDGDNDNVTDLFVWIFDGGSLGNSSRIFLKGRADGSFECTDIKEGLTHELAFVRYQETIYLVETDFDYNRKAVNGFIVTFYQEGEVREKISLTEEIEDYEPEILYQAEGYEVMAEKYAGKGRKGFWEDSHIAYEIGSAETAEDQNEARGILALKENRTYSIYRSDYNNDGEKEWYWKSIFYPSNASTYLTLQESVYKEGEGEEGGVSLLETYSLEYEGIPLFFWVDTVGEKQIVLLLCYEGLDTEFLYGYLIEGDRVEKVLEINYSGIPMINCRLITDLPTGVTAPGLQVVTPYRIISGFTGMQDSEGWQ